MGDIFVSFAAITALGRESRVPRNFPSGLTPIFQRGLPKLPSLLGRRYVEARSSARGPYGFRFLPLELSFFFFSFFFFLFFPLAAFGTSRIFLSLYIWNERITSSSEYRARPPRAVGQRRYTPFIARSNVFFLFFFPLKTDINNIGGERGRGTDVRIEF